MKRRPLIFRAICALFGLSAARLAADEAVETALSAKNLKWTVWLKGGQQFSLDAATACPEIVRGLSADGTWYDLSAIVFKDDKGKVVGEAFMDRVMAYGCAYPPVKVKFGYKQERRSVWAPIQPPTTP